MRHYICWIWLLLVGLVVACGQTAVSTPQPTPTLSPEARLGKQVFTRECAPCHSLSPDTIIVGPSLAEIASRAETRVPDQEARIYLYTSILRPDDHIVEGFENTMPSNFGKKLTGEEVDGLVAFLQTLQ